MSIPTTRLGQALGLTGGIACGKSTVADAFAALGVPVIDTDVISRTLVTPPSPWLDRLVDHFGVQILLPDGSLDRAALRQRVFTEAEAKQQVEAILHPAIREQAFTQAQRVTQQHPLVLVVIPLLAEPGVAAHYDWLNRVIGVRCTPRMQRERLLSRPGVDAALADRMIAAQVSDTEREVIVTDWLDNTGTRAALHAQVLDLHRRLLAGRIKRQ